MKFESYGFCTKCGNPRAVVLLEDDSEYGCYKICKDCVKEALELFP